MTKEIDYYGDNDNYIHIKWGDVRKNTNFTEAFKQEYPDFVREYENYFWDRETIFKSPSDVVNYVYDNNIPVHFYFNFTDKPAESRGEIIDYLLRENNIEKLWRTEA